MNGYIDIIYDIGNHHYHDLYKWLQKNCRGKFYTGNYWGSSPVKSIVQFELERDALLFSLKFLS